MICNWLVDHQTIIYGCINLIIVLRGHHQAMTSTSYPTRPRLYFCYPSRNRIFSSSEFQTVPIQYLQKITPNWRQTHYKPLQLNHSAMATHPGHYSMRATMCQICVLFTSIGSQFSLALFCRQAICTKSKTKSELYKWRPRIWSTSTESGKLTMTRDTWSAVKLKTGSSNLQGVTITNITLIRGCS